MHLARAFLALPLREPEPDTPPAFTCVGLGHASSVSRACGARPRCRRFLPTGGQNRRLLPIRGRRYSHSTIVVAFHTGFSRMKNNNRIFPPAQRQGRPRLVGAKQCPTRQAQTMTNGTNWTKGGTVAMSLLPSGYCLLPTAYWLLPTAYWLLPTDIWYPRFCFPD